MSSFSLLLCTFVLGCIYRMRTATVQCKTNQDSFCDCNSHSQPCTLTCSAPDDCSGFTLACNTDNACDIRCTGENMCDGAILNGTFASSLTITCEGTNACSKDTEIYYYGTGDCSLVCVDAQSCVTLKNGNVFIDASITRSFLCIGDDCPNANTLDYFSPVPTKTPTSQPTTTPTITPTIFPTKYPTTNPTKLPSKSPTNNPTLPTITPSTSPTNNPTTTPTLQPTLLPSISPTRNPTMYPTLQPTKTPTEQPSYSPTTTATSSPSSGTFTPTHTPSSGTFTPTHTPSETPSSTPTLSLSFPSQSPTKYPSMFPSPSPTKHPSQSPTTNPSIYPSTQPSIFPTVSPLLSLMIAAAADTTDSLVSTPIPDVSAIEQQSSFKSNNSIRTALSFLMQHDLSYLLSFSFGALFVCLLCICVFCITQRVHKLRRRTSKSQDHGRIKIQNKISVASEPDTSDDDLLPDDDEISNATSFDYRQVSTLVRNMFNVTKHGRIDHVEDVELPALKEVHEVEHAVVEESMSEDSMNVVREGDNDENHGTDTVHFQRDLAVHAQGVLANDASMAKFDEEVIADDVSIIQGTNERKIDTNKDVNIDKGKHVQEEGENLQAVESDGIVHMVEMEHEGADENNDIIQDFSNDYVLTPE